MSDSDKVVTLVTPYVSLGPREPAVEHDRGFTVGTGESDLVIVSCSSTVPRHGGSWRGPEGFRAEEEGLSL